MVCKFDLIGRSIGEAVSDSIAAPVFRQPPLTKSIPKVSYLDMALNSHLRAGRLPALFASLAEKHGPVYMIPRPFQEPLIVLAGWR